MATKQFKIGLSDTDKQNMAQDVYERLLALTFPEYDTTETYAVGDFVVYNDQLYKCIGATSGAWDSTKWQLATLNDLLTDIEDAVAFVNDKANVDGNYPTLTAGLADNLTPYSEDSGNEQTSPFISQGTATKNNTDIVTTGDYALFKEKQGHTLVVNQYVGDNSWSSTANDVSFSREENTHKYTISGTATGNVGKGLLGVADVVPAGHKVLLLFRNYSKTGTNTATIYYEIATYTHSFSLASDNPTRIVETPNPLNLVFACNEGQNVGYEFVLYVIDLTQMFDDDIPQDLLDNPDHFSWYYNGDLSYNAGSLGNANGVKLVCTGRNLLSGMEIGYINPSTGANQSASDALRSDFIVITPNRPISIYAPNYNSSSKRIYVIFYDRTKSYIDGKSVDNWKAGNNYGTGLIDIPANATYFRITTANVTSPVVYNNDITISLYYTPEEGGEGYDKYYPYEEPYVVDTGSEQLLAFDTKTPDGTIHRNTTSVNLGSLSWTYSGTYFYASISGENVIGGGNYLGTKYHLVCSKYVTGTRNQMFENDKTICADGNATQVIQVQIHDSGYNDATAFKTAMNGVYLEYMRNNDDKTTEQGTPFAENLPINDYGMMYWLNSSNNLVGIPQGCKIFYPVNYKGFIDDAYLGANGSASNIITKNNYIKVWERSVSVDSYAGGDIAIENVSDYSFFIVFFDTNTADRPKHTEIVMNTSGRHTLQHTFSFTSDNVAKTGIACRDCTITNSGMTFGEGLVVVDNGETYNPNSMVIPNAVYGVKLGNGSGNEEE